MTSRVGIGYDAHKFADGRRLVLGGVTIPHTKGLAGHSDADVLLHAVMDALLGAAGLGDIGTHFPNTDPKYKDADSLYLLREVLSILQKRDWSVGNVDVSLLAESPKLVPHFGAMRDKISTALAISPDQVGLKATTNEGMGFVGRGEGMAAIAVAYISK